MHAGNPDYAFLNPLLKWIQAMGKFIKLFTQLTRDYLLVSQMDMPISLGTPHYHGGEYTPTNMFFKTFLLLLQLILLLVYRSL